MNTRMESGTPLWLSLKVMRSPLCLHRPAGRANVYKSRRILALFFTQSAQSIWFSHTHNDRSCFSRAPSRCCDGTRLSKPNRSQVSYCLPELMRNQFSDYFRAHRACGTTISDEQIVAAEAHFQQNGIHAPKAKSDGDVTIAAASIPVAFHVISADSSLSGGNIPYVYNHSYICLLCRLLTRRNHSDSQIASQISVLNQAYASAGITWVLSSTTRTTNSTWFNNVGPDSSYQTTMKNALRTGGSNTLNVYTVGFVKHIFTQHVCDVI